MEQHAEDTSEIIWNQIEKVIGKRFWDIDLEEKAVQYVFVKGKVQEPIDIKNQQSSRKNDSNSRTSSKTWWQFWK